MTAPAPPPAGRALPDGAPRPIDPFDKARHPILRAARRLVAYHRMDVEGTVRRGPCLYVALHGAGYLVLDLVLAGYFLGWKEFWETGDLAEWRPLRIVGAESKVEKFIPGVPRAKELVGIIGTGEEDCVSVLERGEALLVTPGGMREAQPARDFYRLKWEGRYGFVRLALRTGAPIIPLAVVGGAEAYPGLRWKKLSFWSPLPFPAKLRMAVGEPIEVPRRPEAVRDLSIVRPLHERAWAETQALYDRLKAKGGR